jgi:hypothetical protein
MLELANAATKWREGVAGWLGGGWGGWEEGMSCMHEHLRMRL